MSMFLKHSNNALADEEPVSQFASHIPCQSKGLGV